MADRLLDRGRALVGNTVSSCFCSRQLNHHLMTVVTDHVPRIAVEFVHEILGGKSHIQMVGERYCHSLWGDGPSTKAGRIPHRRCAILRAPVASNKRPPTYDRLPRGRPRRPAAIEPRLKPVDSHDQSAIETASQRKRALLRSEAQAWAHPRVVGRCRHTVRFRYRISPATAFTLTYMKPDHYHACISSGSGLRQQHHNFIPIRKGIYDGHSHSSAFD
jgi:hypothetical protein